MIKKFGYSYEKQQEDIIDICDKNVVLLNEDKEKAIITTTGVNHVLIEGDNYACLKVLYFVLKNKPNIIYIDPPWNTGSDLPYTDTLRHSKWASMMEYRLRLAQELLADDGVIFLSIDDNEQHRLRMICDDVFKINNFIATVVVITNKGGRSDDKFIATTHEYIHIYAKDKNLLKLNGLQLTPEQEEEYKLEDEFGRYKERNLMKTGSDSNKEDRIKMFYPIYVCPETLEISLDEKDGWNKIEPLDSVGKEKRWRWEKKTLLNKINDVVVKKINNRWQMFEKVRLILKGHQRTSKPLSHWDNKSFSTASGTNAMKKIIGEGNFKNPKAPALMREVLNIASKKDSIILDFFAGSGTMGQAIIELNKDDGGQRRFIGCTNNENGICEKACYPRLRNAINLSKSNDGLHVYRTAFSPIPQTDNEKYELFKQSVDLIKLREGCFNPNVIKEDCEIYESNGNFVVCNFEGLDENEILEKSSVYSLSLTVRDPKPLVMPSFLIRSQNL